MSVPELGENTQVKANLTFVAKVIAITGSAIWGWSELTNRMSSMEMQMTSVQQESTLLGDLSARMMHIEKFADQAKADLNHLVAMQDKPITSDFEQFERLKYLEKELDIVRQKLDQIPWK